MANYFFESFFNPCGETVEKHKMYAEFLCGAVVMKCHKPKGDSDDLTERQLV